MAMPPSVAQYVKGIAVVLGVALVVGGVVYSTTESTEDKLHRFDFDMTKAEAAELFDVTPTGNRLEVRFASASYESQYPVVITSAWIEYPDGAGKKTEFWLWGGGRFDEAGAYHRLESLAPPTPPFRGDLETDNGSLGVDPGPESGTIHAENLASPAAANAYWRVALYLAYGEPSPTPEDLDIVNGG